MCDGGSGGGDAGDMGDIGAAAAAAAADMGATAGMSGAASAAGQAGQADMGGMDPDLAQAIADDIAMSAAQGFTPSSFGTDMSGMANNNPEIGPTHAQSINGAFSQNQADQAVTGLYPSQPVGLLGLVARSMYNPMTNKNAIGFGFNPGNLAGTIASGVTGVPGFSTLGGFMSPTMGFASPDMAGTGFGAEGGPGGQPGDSGGYQQTGSSMASPQGQAQTETSAAMDPSNAYTLNMPEYARGILDTAPQVSGPNILDYLTNYHALNEAFRLPSRSYDIRR